MTSTAFNGGDRVDWKNNKTKSSEIRLHRRFIWKNVVIMSYIHMHSIYSVTQLRHCYLQSICFGLLTGFLSELGITAGSHRLWTHRSYKAKLPLRIFLMLINSLALQNSIFDWSRDHRTHHKYSETDADPHNARRGFFFSHVGWLLVRKHPDVIAKGKNIILADLHNDPVVMFQKKYYVPLSLLLCFVLPSLIPWYFWNESLWIAYCISVLRYCCTLNITWCVNSVAHMYGDRPYDRTIHPAENKFVAFSAIGEGFHNYHHTFPHDYSTSEFGMKLNPTTAFIDLMAFVGLAYDRRMMSKSTVRRRMERTGALSASVLAYDRRIMPKSAVRLRMERTGAFSDLVLAHFPN